jgi:hypothetical protein
MLRFAALALLLTAAPATAEQFTIRCERQGAGLFLTFDTSTDHMISETIHGGTYRGQIIGSSETEIRFVMLVGGPTHPDLFFMRKEGHVDVQNGPDRTVDAEHCVPAPLRDVLGLWDRWG